MFPGGVQQLIRISRPSLSHVRASVLSVAPSSDFEGVVRLYVKRDEVEWDLNNDRDVEELAGTSTSRETIYVVSSIHAGPRAGVNLRDFPLPRKAMPCAERGAPDVLNVEEEGKLDGLAILCALQQHGYFRVRLQKTETKEAISKTFAATESFFRKSAAKKLDFQGKTCCTLAPSYGYRCNSLSKEYFVFRNTSLLPLPPELVDLGVGFASLGGLLTKILDALLVALGWDPERIQQALDGMLAPVNDTYSLQHSSLMEVFRYDCSPRCIPYSVGQRYAVPCGEHRDASILTIVPRCAGDCSGLEVDR
jgi:hypothetical protein